jgi:hypothetical protein
MSRLVSITAALLIPCLLAACGSDDGDDGAADPDAGAVGRDPDAAPRVTVDRFSASAGHLMVRDPSNQLPAAGAAIDFDQPPFITTGLSPTGEVTRYYNFDVQPTTPASIYVLVRDGQPVPGQLNIVDVIPGDSGYNDFWRVVTVDAPAGYVANTVTSLDAVVASGFAMTVTDTLVNCPIVPEGSTARLRYGGAAGGLHRGWYRDQVVTYFTFDERALRGATVPTSPIYVTFNVNPGLEGGGPPSGFVTETASAQTHNVVGTSPTDAGYSPLWAVQIYDNGAFASVADLDSAALAPVLVADAATVNCPIVE